jgi:hypothetical protein
MSNDETRRQGFRPLSAFIPRSAAKAFKGKGLAQADIAARWPEIVGEQLAQASLPERLKYPAGRNAGGTLTVRVTSAFAPHLQHLAPLIIEKINTFYGHAVVDRITLVQRPLPPRKQPPTRATRPLTPAEQAALDAQLASVQDEALRQQLAALGRQLAARRRPPPG